ncbi:uncharacterized protein BDFB_008642, partial [Asbolus verrucosus]
EISPTRATKPEDSLKIEGLQEFQPLYSENFIEYPVEKPLRFKPEKSSFEIIDYNENEMKENPSETERLLTEIRSKYIKHSNIERPHLLKRPTNLKLEGDLYATTEQAEKFIEYLLTRRPDLMKKPTTLKMEGKMDIKTETRDKFVPFEPQPKPPLCKKLTNLHLEGDLNTITEKQEQYVPYELQKRPPLMKKHTNLNIEGQLDLLPEYRKEFIEYKAERPKLALPVNNLKTDGFYDVMPDASSPFQQQIHPQIPYLRETETLHEESRVRVPPRKRESSLRPEGQMETTTENKTQFVQKSLPRSDRIRVTNNLQLEGRIDLNPEYKNAYVDFNKDERISPTRIKSRRLVQESNFKSEGKMDISPEYSRSYVDFPRKRPQVKRPECSLSSEGEIDHMTEKNEKYVPYPNAPRTGPLKRESELKLEGDFECQPEYRKAYIDYLVREREVTLNEYLKMNSSRKQRWLTWPHQSKKRTTNGGLQSPKGEDSKKNKNSRNRSLSQIETAVFGPKLNVPSKKTSSSRSTSPVPSNTCKRKSKTLPRTKNVSPTCQNSTDSEFPSQKTRKFGNPVRVENLAYRSTTPVLPLIDVSARNKWMRDSSTESTSAFVVLDKGINGNY